MEYVIILRLGNRITLDLRIHSPKVPPSKVQFGGPLKSRTAIDTKVVAV
jgi:hypothetical protein